MYCQCNKADSRLDKGTNNRWAQGKPGNPKVHHSIGMPSAQYTARLSGFPPQIAQSTAGMPNLVSTPYQARPPMGLHCTESLNNSSLPFTDNGYQELQSYHPRRESAI